MNFINVGCLLFSVSLSLLAPAQTPVATASELLTQGETAYNRQDWNAAAQAFQTFLTEYEGIEGTEEATRRVRPLTAICLVRLEQYEAAAPLLEEALRDDLLDPLLRTDLRFFAGLTACRTGQYDKAREQLGRLFHDTTVEVSRRMEALLLGGLSYVMEENWTGAADFFQKYQREIRIANPEAGARADLLHLHARMRAGRWQEALELACDLHTRRDELRQVVTFATLLIELGTHFLEEEQSHQAITALRLVPTRKDLLSEQQARIANAEADLRHAQSSRNSVRQSQVQSSLNDMAKDLATLEQMPQFDPAARLRLARAYHQLGRTREACLILDQMVRQMDPDPVVESASVHLINGWMSLGRWNRAARAAEVYLERLGNLAEAQHLPAVLFARAQALEGQHRYEQAATAYADVHQRYPNDPLAPRAAFMEAYHLLQLERSEEARTRLDHLLESLPANHELREHAVFWRAMTFYFDQQWEEAREHLAPLRKVPGEYQDDACFRHAYAFFAEAQYEQAVTELTDFEKQHPSSEWLAEAQLTLGDALGALGELDSALAAYRRIDVAASGFHDEGWMKIGQIFKKRRDMPGLKAHYQAFLKQRPDSPRITEALHGLGWAARQEDRIDEARQMHWEALQRFGNEPVRPALEDIFLALTSFYPGDQQAELLERLQRERHLAESRSQRHYAIRLAWTEAQLRQRRHPEEARQQLAKLGEKLNPEETAPRLLCDCAEALTAQGDAKAAERLFEGLRRWHPRALERDRAFAGLGFLALARHDEKSALKWFDRFEKTTVLPKSAPDANGISLVEAEIGGKVALARADLLKTTDSARALALYLAVQKSKALPSRLRAEAFISAAGLLSRRGDLREALPYYEQVYVLFNRHPDLVARAYWERGQVLEKLGLKDKAREVYSELAQREDLQAQSEATQGRTRAEALGGLIKARLPEGGEIPPAPTKPNRPS